MASTPADKMRALQIVGVPYTDADIAGAEAAVAGKPEVEAVVAYLQQLGTVIPAIRHQQTGAVRTRHEY
jgi:cytochrome c oxidase cbb3-type subunit 2